LNYVGGEDLEVCACDTRSDPIGGLIGGLLGGPGPNSAQVSVGQGGSIKLSGGVWHDIVLAGRATPGPEALQALKQLRVLTEAARANCVGGAG
jgi:hypothetical protein